MGAEKSRCAPRSSEKFDDVEGEESFNFHAAEGGVSIALIYK